jgi:hypothetical protein
MHATGNTIPVSPADNWCALINAAQPGDDLVFAPGNYPQTCFIRARGTALAKILIRSQSEAAGQRATFIYPGASSNVLDLDGAAFVTLRGFAFAATQPNIDAIRIRQADDIVIERNTFTGVGGIPVPANNTGTVSRRITIRDNVFRDTLSTVIYLGCHSGNCQVLDAVIERNLIDGTLPGDGVGYGMQIKLNSQALIRDNSVYRTRGPGIMVYGSDNGTPASVIEGNYVEGAVDDANINVGGGPAVVRNNVSVGGGYAGIRAQNYGGRNLQANVQIVHNTVLNAPVAGIDVQGWSAASNVLANNAILPQTSVPAVRGAPGAATVNGNVTCTTACFVSASVPFDLMPATGSPLLAAAGSGSETWRPADDFMGETRAPAPAVGAFESVAAPLPHTLGAGLPRPARRSGGSPTITPTPGPSPTPVGPPRAYVPFVRR